MSNNNYNNTSYYNEQFSTLQVASLARAVLPPYKERHKAQKNLYHCPSCGGKLYISTGDTKICCVSNGCLGIYKLILKQGGQWIDHEALKRERDQQREIDRRAKQVEQEKLGKVQEQLKLVHGQGLTEKDFDEFEKSAISRELAVLNFCRLTSNDDIARYLGWKRYTHTPGWVSLGTDFKGNPSYKGQFKPDTPIQVFQKRPSKYLTCRSGYDALMPNLPDTDWNKVVADKTIPLYVAEGMKKALALYGLGRLCLAIPGVSMWDLPNIHRMAVNGRKIGLVYDSDWRINGQVLAQLIAFANSLREKGCDVYILTWDPHYKGVDDFIVSGNIESLKEVPFDEWFASLDKTIFANDGSEFLLDDSEQELQYFGPTVSITDRYDLPGSIRIPEFFDKELLLEKIHAYRNMGCRRFDLLTVEQLKAIAKEYSISLSFTAQDLLDKLGDTINRDDYANTSLVQLKKLCKQHGIAYDLSKADITERLEKAGIDKDSIDWGEKADKLTISVKIDHPSDVFIANIINAENPYLGNNLFDCYLPFDLLQKGQWLLFNKAMRNDPRHMDRNPLFAEYLRMKSFTADITTHTRFLSDDSAYQNIDLNQPKVYCIKSGLGTGKTFLMIELLKRVDLIKKASDENPDAHIMLVGYRNGLIANTISKLKASGIDMKDAKTFKNSPIVKKGERAIVGFCIDSLMEINARMHTDWEKNTILIFDEYDNVTSHTVTGGTVWERRPEILDKWNQLLNVTEKGIICLSGTINDTVLKVFSDVEKEQVRIENKTDRQSIPLDFVLGSGESIKDILTLREKDSMAMFDDLISLLISGKNAIASSDGQKHCEKIHEYIKDFFGDKIKVLRIDGKTRSKDESKAIVDAILANPKLLMEMGYQLLIYNSSAESGVDIDLGGVDYFSRQYHWGFSVVSVDSTIQMLRRYRGGCPITLWTSPQALSKMNVLSNDDYKFVLRCKAIESGQRWQEQSNKFLNLAEDLDFISRFEKKYPRHCLIYALNQHGYTVNFIANDESDTSLSEQTERIEINYANEIFSADDKYIGENLYNLRVEDDTSWEDQMAIKKAHYFANFNYSHQDLLQETAELFTPEIIREIEYENRHFFSHCKNFVYVEQDKATLKMLQRNTYKDKVFFNDIRLLALPIDAIQKSGLLDLITRENDEFKKELSPDDPIFTKISKYATSHPRRWLELTDDRYSERMFFNQIQSVLSKFFGIKFLRKKTKCIIVFPQLELSAVPRIKEHILEKIEKIKAYNEDVQSREVAQDHVFYDYRNDVVPELPVEEIESEPINHTEEQVSTDVDERIVIFTPIDGRPISHTYSQVTMIAKAYNANSIVLYAGVYYYYQGYSLDENDVIVEFSDGRRTMLILNGNQARFV